MKSPKPRSVSDKSKANRPNGPKPWISQKRKAMVEEPIPTNKISAQVWNKLSQILPIVKAPGKTKSIVGFQTGLTQTTKIDEVFPTLQSKQQLAARLKRTYSADFNADEIILAETLGGLTKLIVSKLPRKLEPLGRP